MNWPYLRITWRNGYVTEIQLYPYTHGVSLGVSVWSWGVSGEVAALLLGVIWDTHNPADCDDL